MKFLLIFVFFIVFSLKNNQISCDHFSSTDELKSLVDLESYLIESLDEYILETQNVLNEVIRLRNELTEENGIALEDVNDYVTNPIAALKLIRRLSVDWLQLMEFLETDENDFSQLFKVFEKAFPDLSDLEGAVNGVIRIQSFYNLKTKDLVNGVLQGQYFENSLSEKDCFEIAKSYFEMKQFKRSAEWFKEAKRLNFNSNHDSIVIYLANSYGKLGKYKKALHLISEELDDDNENKNSLIKYYKESLQKDTIFQEEHHKDHVCGGNIKVDPKISKNLFCAYGHFYAAPFLKIAPFKVEYLNLDPPIRQFYDVVTDDEIEYIKKTTTPYLKRSKSGFEDPRVSDYRVSKSIGIALKVHNFLSHFDQRLNDITGLDTNSSESLQVANYGIGGHYDEHHDFIEGTVNENEGNRILTALYYLEDVELGGGTAFIHLNVLVPPIKNSMVLWYNLYPTGKPDYRTLHVGCPVIKGSKWILTSWIRERGQELLSPCPVEYNPQMETVI
ncbi:hypothetical protein ACFFRR_006151 [Megaselia abdita]